MTNKIKNELDAIFSAKSIAFIGASNDKGKWGYRTLLRYLRGGSLARAYPVNQKGETVQGLKAYPSILDIPDEVDLAVVTIPGPLVAGVMEDCVKKGVKGAVVISAGFAETGEEGRTMQDNLLRIVQGGNIRMIGPNCMGIWSAPARLNLCFDSIPNGGNISFISQSGTFGGYLAEMAAVKGYGLSRFVSAGNQADLNAADYLEYLAEDPETKAIIFYLEGLDDGRRFFDTAREVVKHKPITVYKAGRTNAGERAAKSHTGSLSGADTIFDAMCRQSGIIRAYESIHPFDISEALSMAPIPAGKRVAIVAGGGGYCVTTADACASLGLDLPLIDPETQKKLKAQLLPHAPWPVNPIDTAADWRPMTIPSIAKQLASLDYVDGIIANAPFAAVDRLRSADSIRAIVSATEELISIPEKLGKPLVVSMMRGLRGGNIVTNMFRSAGIPAYETPEECARAMYGLMQYGSVRRRAHLP